MNLAQFLKRSALAHGERPALAHGDEIQATYAEFYDHVRRLARTLKHSLGVQPGERVAIFCANHPHYLEVAYAGWWAGAALVPINAKLHPKEAAYILTDSQAQWCWVDPEQAEVLRPLVSGVQFFHMDDALGLMGDSGLDVVPRDTDDLAWLFYTSGTTGRPKGVMLSHGNLLQATLSYLSDVKAVEPGDALLHAAPMSHGSGLYNFAYVARAGLNVVAPSRGFDEVEVLQLAQRYPGLSMFAAPTMVKRLVRAARLLPEAVQCVGTVIYGGGPMYLADIQEALQVMGPRFAQIYGQGESPMTITVLPTDVIAHADHPRYLQRLSSVGFAQMSVEVSIRSDQGEDLEPGQIGEICVRGPVVMKGYWRNPEATAQTLRGGWLYTGDVGVLDEEGFLTLKDRSKDVIISGGTNIYPREVEEALLMHPRVREVSVVGQADPEWGEAVLAFVVTDGTDVTPQELDAVCLEHIARFKRPKHYRFVTELPKNNYGKVLKTALRESL